jgi:hypothetical protein
LASGFFLLKFVANIHYTPSPMASSKKDTIACWMTAVPLEYAKFKSMMPVIGIR